MAEKVIPNGTIEGLRGNTDNLTKADLENDYQWLTQDKIRKPSPEVINWALKELHVRRAVHLEFIQAMMDGTTLGAEQVQDKRLDLLEQGPTVDFSDVILVIVLVIILEGTVGPAVASAMTAAALRPILRAMARGARQAERRAMIEARKKALEAGQKFLNKRGLPFRERMNNVDLSYRLDKTADMLKGSLLGKYKESREVGNIILDIMKSTEENLAASVISIPYEIHYNVPGQWTLSLSHETTAGVEVQAVAMATASLFRLAVIEAHEKLEVELKNPETTQQQVMEILDKCSIDTDIQNIYLAIGHIRETFQIASEAMIWAQLLLNNGKKDLVRDHMNVTQDWLKKGGKGLFYHQGAKPLELEVDERLRNYLLTRFRKEWEPWARKTNAMVGRYSSRIEPPSWDRNNVTEQEDLLVQYLTTIADRVHWLKYGTDPAKF